MALRIWSNVNLSAAAAAQLAEQLAPHAVLWSEAPPGAAAGRAEMRLEEADVLFGQPDVAQCLAAARLSWVHVTSAGWDRFDVPQVRAHLAARGAQLSSSSSVYSEPCAQHALGFMLAEARQLSRSARHQVTDHAWPQLETRAACTLLGPEATVALVGFGSIGVRIAELLSPFGVRVIGVRRTPTGREPVPTVPLAEIASVLPKSDHVINLLPGGLETRQLFDAAVFAHFKAGSVFYNIGRGSTVDQDALLAALERGQVRAAYLDVADPEPLPAEHPLWRAPNCTITPHSAGGHANEQARLSSHFVCNLERFCAGQPLVDRVL